MTTKRTAPSTTTTKTRVPFLLRLSPRLKAKLEELAQREHRSLNRQIEYLLERSIREESKHRSGGSAEEGLTAERTA